MLAIINLDYLLFKIETLLIILKRRALDDKDDKENQTEDFTVAIYELLEEVYTRLEQVSCYIN